MTSFKFWTVNWKRPLLAASLGPNEDFALTSQAFLASPKIDGLRCLLINGQFKSRSMKLLPNKELQKKALWLKEQGIDGLDGELTIGEPFGKEVFQKTTSAIRRVEDALPPDLRYNVFDLFRENQPFNERLSELNEILKGIQGKPEGSFVRFVNQVFIPSTEILLQQEEAFLSQGYEGLMLRSLEGLYKQNRSTLNEGILLKLKRFQDAEAVVIGTFPLERNFNPSKLNELGFTTHSSHQGLKVADNLLGGFLVKDLETGEEFSIGTGFSMDQRELFWKQKTSCLKKILKYKFFPKGIKEKPRHPVFLGFRDSFDLL